MRSVEVMLEKGRRVAAHLFEAAESDVVYREGEFAVAVSGSRGPDLNGGWLKGNPWTGSGWGM